MLRDLQAERGFNVILVTHDLRESGLPGRHHLRDDKSRGASCCAAEVDLPRAADLDITYTPAFGEIVHELRGHIGAR